MLTVIRRAALCCRHVATMSRHGEVGVSLQRRRLPTRPRAGQIRTLPSDPIPVCIEDRSHHAGSMIRQQTGDSRPTSGQRRGRRTLLAAAVVHPVPSVIAAVLVAILATIAGGERSTAGLLAIAMLGYQFSIGALNDVTDARDDRGRKPPKPIPAGLVPSTFAIVIVVLGAAVGLGVSASFGMVVLVLGASGYATGVAYDLMMRRLGLGWLCFAAAFPLLLAWTWMAAAGTLPPGWPFLY